MAGGKKGKGKGPPRPPPAAQPGQSKKNAPKENKNLPTDEEMLIFTTDKPKKKGAGASNDGTNSAMPAPNKPTVKQIIGGASWTGKLPVNLLSEHCQKQKWEKPDYSMVSIVLPSSPYFLFFGLSSNIGHSTKPMRASPLL